MLEKAASGQLPGKLTRQVTAFTAGCVLVSNMIGTGIFGTTGFMARDIGSPMLILLLWLIGAGFALLGAFCYSELGACIPRAGGEYVYLRQTYGPVWGFLSGWASLTIGFSAAIASNAHLFAIHLHQLFPQLQPWAVEASWARLLVHPRSIGLMMVWGLTAVHVFGVGAGGFLQRLLTVIKVGSIVLFLLLAVSSGTGDWGHLRPPTPAPHPGLTTLLVSFLFVTFSYAGWNAASYIAGEMKDPGRSVPRSMIWGTLCVGVLYLALNTVYFYALDVESLASTPLEPVAQKSSVAMFGAQAARWVTLMLCVSVLGAASAMTWAGPRVYFAMAQDRVFPAMFAETTAGSGCPAKSIMLQATWVSLLVVSARFEQLLVYASFVLMLFTALTVAGVFVLRVKRPDLDRPYHTYLYPLTPALYLVISLAVMGAALKLRPQESLWGIATVLAGLPVYLLWKRTTSKSAGRGASG